MRAYRPRKNKGYNYSNRKRTEDYVARIVLGKSKKEEPFRLCHTSTFQSQKINDVLSEE